MKRKLIAVLMSAFCLAAAIPSAVVLADGQKVVTLGADLTDDQKQAVLRYFGVAGQNIQTLTITNQDERDHLGSYVPLEQIGTKTFSCALVSPTTSGGIQVKTANLSWVTSNMIATTLSTSGVVNCDVLAAAPFEVSGTGALTGILMAYENAVGESLDTEKKEVATQELITTTTIANNIGTVQATEIVNESKMQVIQGNVVSGNDIDVIINEVASEENISLTDDDRALLADLLAQIAQQDYDYEEMKETLERVESNLDELSSSISSAQTEETQETSASSETETQETLAADSILMNTDDSALGESVVFDATDNAALSETEGAAQTEAGTDGFEIVSSDSYTDSETADQPETSEAAGEDQPDTSYAEDGILDGGFDIGVEYNEEETSVSDQEITEAAETETSDQVLSLSDMVFGPTTSDANNYTVYPAGVNVLTVSFQRQDIQAGSGALNVFNAADSTTFETVYLNDTSKVSFEPLTSDELADLGWSEGMKAVIYLSNPLAQSSGYFVTLSEDAFESTDGASSEATPDSYSWMLETSQYGFAIDQSKTAGAKAGNTASAQIMIDGTDAGYACIDNLDESMITFDQTEYWASGSCTATFLQSGDTSFDVSIYDNDGNYLDGIHYTITIH